MRKVISSTLCLLFFFVASSQSVPLAGLYTRLGAYRLQRVDVFSFGANQAALSGISAVTAGVYGERRFLLQELGYYQAVLALPTPSGNFGFKGSYLGSGAHYEAQVGLAYGRKLGEKVAVGAQFNYHALQVRGYGGASAVSFEAGVLFRISPELHVGVHAANPTAARLGKSGEERLASLYSAGVGYVVSERFLLAGEVLKVEGAALDVHGGMQYNFDQRLFARCGFTSQTSSYYFGLGILLNTLRLDAAASVHPQLGITPGLSLIFNGKSPKNE